MIFLVNLVRSSTPLLISAVGALLPPALSLILAQIPATTAGELGSWIVALAGVVGVIVLCLTGINQYKQMVAVQDQYVTRDELSAIEKALSEKLDKSEHYTRTRFHELADSVNQVSLRVAEQPITMRHMIDTSLAPMSAKVDRMAITLAAIATKVGAQVHLAPVVEPPDA